MPAGDVCGERGIDRLLKLLSQRDLPAQFGGLHVSCVSKGDLPVGDRTTGLHVMQRREVQREHGQDRGGRVPVVWGWNVHAVIRGEHVPPVQRRNVPAGQRGLVLRELPSGRVPAQQGRHRVPALPGREVSGNGGHAKLQRVRVGNVSG